MKRCSKCGVVQSVENFYAAKGGRDGRRGDCKDCFRKRAAERYRRDPEAAKARVKRWQQQHADRLSDYRRRRRELPEVKRRERSSYLLRTYGITADEYDAMLEAQGGGCAICGRPPRPDISLHVDHEPSSGRVRSLLCFRCDNLLGDAGDDPVLLRAAAAYIDRHLEPLIRARIGDLVASRTN